MHLTDNLDDIVSLLKAGGCILYPTDTIWGIGCSALNEEAIQKIYSIKNRPNDKPFILLVSDLNMLKRYVDRIHPRVETLLDYYDRPLTVVYKNVKNLPPSAMSAEKTVAIRITRDPFCKDLIRMLNAPLVSTSANLSGDPIPAHYGEIHDTLKDKVDYIVRFRQKDTNNGAASIIISFDEEGELKFLRV